MVKNFKPNCLYFGWKQVEDIYLRDQAHFKNYSVRRTNCTKEIIVLDGYSMMNTTYTETIFSDIFSDSLSR